MVLICSYTNCQTLASILEAVIRAPFMFLALVLNREWLSNEKNFKKLGFNGFLLSMIYNI